MLPKVLAPDVLSPVEEICDAVDKTVAVANVARLKNVPTVHPRVRIGA
jgi:hypothetical protein